MKLVIVHYHLRPSGVRRVIELATPHLCRTAKVDSIVLACGEAPDVSWSKGFFRAVRPASVEIRTEPVFNYVSEQCLSPARLSEQITAALSRLLRGGAPGNCIVWAHNLGIGRNLHLSQALAAVCEARGLPLIAHHHDWWFDNRWLRWPEMQRSGVRTLRDAARTIFPRTKTIQHVAINRADTAVLQRHIRGRAHWLPNLIERGAFPTTKRVLRAQRWLQSQVGDKDAPIWILPCRLLRRKNIAEALLLARWLRPEAWVVTTGGISSEAERRYFEKLLAGTRRYNWPLRLGVLAGQDNRSPSVAELMAASECVLLTSAQEGFGLPYLEAAAANRPLIARSLPNVAPDLTRFGFRLPQCYDEVNIHTDLFDWRAERTRQRRQFVGWKRRLPARLRQLANPPTVLAKSTKPEAVPFSRLTLDAQLQVLAHPAAHSWQLCAPLNPRLRKWQQRAASRALEVTRWPRTAGGWLSGKAYARRFQRILEQHATPPMPARTGLKVQADFFEQKLAAINSYPLLWKSEV